MKRETDIFSPTLLGSLVGGTTESTPSFRVFSLVFEYIQKCDNSIQNFKTLPFCVRSYKAT